MKNKILMGLCLFTTVSAYGADNLIDNPGFESALAGWTTTGSFSAVKNAQSGFYSARGGTTQGTLVQNVMSKLTVGGKYSLSMYGKLDSMGVSSMLSIRFKNPRGGILQENRMVIGSTDWKQYSTTFTVPVGSTIAEIYAIKESGAASYMYVDALSLVSLDAAKPVNSAPAIIGSQIINATEDTSITFNFGAATDADGDAITYTKLTNPASGSLVCDGGASRTCVYTPVANFSGPVSFTYKANDGKVDSNIGTVTINVAAVNDAPTLPTDQSVATAGNTAVNFTLNPATDVDSSSFTYTLLTKPSSGTVVCTGSSCTYTPTTGFSGSTSFTYKANDGLLDSNVATVTVAVAPIPNRAPVLANTSQSVSTAYNKAVNFNLLSATDADGDALSYSVVTNPSSGAVVCTTTACTYTPATGFSGSTSFTYKANDGKLDSNLATVSLTVTPKPNDAPVLASTAQGYSFAYNTAGSFNLLSATDVDNDTLTYSIVAKPSSGTVVCVGLACNYTPAAGFSGVTSFTYKANDGKADSNVATVTLTVTPKPNDAPVLASTAQGYSFVYNTAGSFNLLSATDVDNDALTYSIVTQPSSGSVVCAGLACNYTPVVGFSGVTSFTYKANDGKADSNVATVTLTVAPKVNDAPVIGSATQSYLVPYNTAVSLNLLAATDVDNDALTYTIVAKPSSGNVVCAATACTYTPASGFSGVTSFTYKANDGKADSNVATVILNVAAQINTAPALGLATQSYLVPYNTAVSLNLLAATDADGDTLSYAIVAKPSSGNVVCTVTACTYTPASGFSGVTSFTYKANDGQADSNTATVTLTVAAPVNNAPVIGSAVQSYTTPYNTAASFNLLAGTDADGDILSYAIVTKPSSGTALCTGIVCSYTPAAGFSGTVNFTYKANDGKADSNTATVTIVVSPSIPAPVVGYSPRGVGGGGAMSGVSISPYANLWFVGTDMGTLFKSTDLGLSWNAVSHNQAVFDSDLTKAVSVGFSADGVTVFHAAAGITPKRSTNSGDTFTAISMGLASGELIKYWMGDSSNANIMYAGTTKGLLRSINKGTSWTRVNSEEAIGTFIDFNTAGKVYHATKTKILVSNDNGLTFSTYYAPATGIRLFAGGSDASGVTLAISDFDGVNACSWAIKYTNDWGQTSIDQTTAACGYIWTEKNGAGFVKNAQAVGDHLRMAENDSTTIYAVGGKSWIRQYGTKVYVSRDKGQTWGLKLNQIDYDTVPYAPWPSSKLEWSAVALDIGWWDSGYESFSINQRNSAVVAGSGYFFMHSSLNAGENWKAPFTEYADTGTPAAGKKWKTRGLEVISVYKMKFHPTNTDIMYGASADIGGLVSEDHGVSFRIPKSAYNSWYDFAFDPADDMVAYGASGSLHDFPNEWHANAVTGNGGIYKTVNRGKSWTRLTPVDTNYNRQFISVAYDSKNDILYGGSQEVGIAVSKNDGVTWTYNNTGLPAGNKIIPQIEVDPNTGNVYALLTGDAPTFSNQATTGIYFLDVANGATSWKLLRGTVNYPKDASAGYKLWYYPTAFAIDFNNPSTLWLVDYENKGNWLMTGAWKSTDNGATWNRVQQITHPTDIKIDPKNNNQVHVAAYHQLDGAWGNGGMLYTTNGGTTWSKNTLPPLQVNSRSVTIDPNDSSKIFYSYFGGGILYGANPAFGK